MKTKLSISLEQETVQKIEEHIKRGTFRNKSHAVEFALNKLVRE